MLSMLFTTEERGIILTCCELHILLWSGEVQSHLRVAVTAARCLQSMFLPPAPSYLLYVYVPSLLMFFPSYTLTFVPFTFINTMLIPCILVRICSTELPEFACQQIL